MKYLAIMEGDKVQEPLQVSTARARSTYKWYEQFEKELIENLCTTSRTTMYTLLDKFLLYVRASVTYNAPRKALKLHTIMENVLTVFASMTRNIDGKFSSDSLYLNKMTNLIAIFLDMKVRIAHLEILSLKKLAQDMTSTLFLYLGHSEDHMAEALLKMKLTTSNYRDLLNPVFNRMLSYKALSPLTAVRYYRYLLLFKIWSRILRDNHSRKRQIIKLASDLKPSAEVTKLTKELKCMPSLQGSENRNLTMFLLNNYDKEFLKLKKKFLECYALDKDDVPKIRMTIQPDGQATTSVDDLVAITPTKTEKQYPVIVIDDDDDEKTTPPVATVATPPPEELPPAPEERTATPEAITPVTEPDPPPVTPPRLPTPPPTPAPIEKPIRTPSPPPLPQPPPQSSPPPETPAPQVSTPVSPAQPVCQVHEITSAASPECAPPRQPSPHPAPLPQPPATLIASPPPQPPPPPPPPPPPVPQQLPQQPFNQQLPPAPPIMYPPYMQPADDYDHPQVPVNPALITTPDWLRAIYRRRTPIPTMDFYLAHSAVHMPYHHYSSVDDLPPPHLEPQVVPTPEPVDNWLNHPCTTEPCVPDDFLSMVDNMEIDLLRPADDGLRQGSGTPSDSVEIALLPNDANVNLTMTYITEPDDEETQEESNKNGIDQNDASHQDDEDKDEEHIIHNTRTTKLRENMKRGPGRPRKRPREDRGEDQKALFEDQMKKPKGNSKNVTSNGSSQAAEQNKLSSREHDRVQVRCQKEVYNYDTRYMWKLIKRNEPKESDVGKALKRTAPSIDFTSIKKS